MTHELKDITIIGAGPAGLYALFYAGMRGVTAQVIDALPQVGGQLAALYPEKLIFDVAGFPRVLAKDLVSGLNDQAAQFGNPMHLNRTVTGLDELDGHFVVRTTDGDFPTRAVVIAGGIGAFSPRKLPQTATHPWYGKGIDDVVLDPARYTNKRILIVGGGDSAFDWAQQLRPRALSVTLIHRTDRFRAHQATVDDVMDAYVQSWQLGLKAVAIYRDGSKKVQPLNTSAAKKQVVEERIVYRPQRRKLPDEPTSITP